MESPAGCDARARRHLLVLPPESLRLSAKASCALDSCQGPCGAFDSALGSWQDPFGVERSVCVCGGTPPGGRWCKKLQHCTESLSAMQPMHRCNVAMLPAPFATLHLQRSIATFYLDLRLRREEWSGKGMGNAAMEDHGDSIRVSGRMESKSLVLCWSGVRPSGLAAAPG